MDGIRTDSLHLFKTDSLTEDTELKVETFDITPLFELRLTAGKGFGLFATQAIPRGTCIVEEPALITIPASVSQNDPERAIHIIQALGPLSRDQLDPYTGLHYNIRSVNSFLRAAIRTYLISKQYTGDALKAAVKVHTTMAAIFNTDCVAMGEDGKLGSGIFQHFSRANHSCTPNVENCFNTITGCEMLHTVRDIDEGEEITVTYIDQLYRPADERQHALRRWEFECECEACEGPKAMASVRRRRRVEEIHRVFDRVEGKSSSWFWQPVRMPRSATEKIQLAEELVMLLREEGLVGMPLAQAYRRCSKYGLEAGQGLKSLEYARSAVEVEQTSIGTVMKLPENAEAWLRLLEEMAGSGDRRFRAERERMRLESERVRKMEEKEAARQAERIELERKSEEKQRIEALPEGKRRKEVMKTAVKKGRRVVRASAERSGLAAVDVDRCLAGLGGEETLAWAEKLQGVTAVSEFRKALDEQPRNGHRANGSGF
ncbi:hypothetical protein B0A55_04811 [Friedmanniomyces simplex]|uniref:SET domain-containing protein n=1 Tax=Friedmanniomyces simplex TaxID=329884 RepID=A0A4U0XJQ1_9PEZI|nr:hypothetical protein B0A55_04811 [Friedmanniomyces simplex]